MDTSTQTQAILAALSAVLHGIEKAGGEWLAERRREVAALERIAAAQERAALAAQVSTFVQMNAGYKLTNDEIAQMDEAVRRLAAMTQPPTDATEKGETK